MSGLIAAASVAAIGVGVSAHQGVQANKRAKEQNKIAQQSADIARDLYADSAPLRAMTGQRLQDFLTLDSIPSALRMPAREDFGLNEFMAGGALPAALTPEALPSVPDMTAANRDILERQFQVARANALNQSAAQGGALADTLGDLEAERALGVTGLYVDQNKLQYEQQLKEAQRLNALNQTLFGVGLDQSNAEWQRKADLRKQLFASALGVANQDAGLALQGLSSANAGIGNAASTALKGWAPLQENLNDLGGAALYMGLMNQKKAGAGGALGGGGSF